MVKYKAKCNTSWGGIIEREVWVDKRLDLMPSAQAGIRKNSYGTPLISYDTLVCSVDPAGWLTCTGTYSASTRRHINRFLKEVAPRVDYYSAKYCYEHDVAMNVNTGEIRELSSFAAA